MKGKTCIIAKFHGTDLVICSHSRERKPKKTTKKHTVGISSFRTLMSKCCCWHYPVFDRGFLCGE